jgi:hypothetical protein
MMRPTAVQIQERGKLTPAAKLRAKYQLDDGDSLTVLDLKGSILLSPRVPDFLTIGMLRSSDADRHGRGHGETC